MSPTPNESLGQKGSLQEEKIKFTTPKEHLDKVIILQRNQENLQEIIKSTTPTGNQEQVSMSALVPVRGEEGGGVSSMSPTPNESFGQRIKISLQERIKFTTPKEHLDKVNLPRNLQCHRNELPPHSTIYTIMSYAPIIRRVTTSGGDRPNSALTEKEGSAHLTPMSTPIPPPTTPTPTTLHLDQYQSTCTYCEMQKAHECEEDANFNFNFEKGEKKTRNLQSTETILPQDCILILAAEVIWGEKEGGGENTCTSEKMRIEIQKQPLLEQNMTNLQYEKDTEKLPSQILKETKGRNKKEWLRRKDRIEKKERYAAKEKFRKDTELYGEIFHDWEAIIKEKEKKMKSEEMKRKERLKRAEKLKGTWDLMITCKDFLEEWEGSWVEGSIKSRMRQDNTRKEMEKRERFEKIEIKKREIKKKMLQTRLNLGVKELGSEGMKEWSETLKHERQELQELKENLWRWRESGGGKLEKKE